MKNALFVIAAAVIVAASVAHGQPTSPEPPREPQTEARHDPYYHRLISGRENSFVGADEISPGETPTAVRNAIQQRLRSAKSDNLLRANINGTNVYQVSFEEDGMEVRLQIAENGNLLNQVRESTSLIISPEQPPDRVAFGSVPILVQRTIRESAGTMPVREIERAANAGNEIYIAVMEANGTRVEIAVGQDGMLLRETREGADTIATQPPGDLIAFDALPRSVRESLEQHVSEEELRTVEVIKRTLNNQTLYHASFLKNNLPVQMLLKDDGAPIRIAVGPSIDEAAGAEPPAQPNELQLDDLPEEIQETVREHIGTGRVISISETADEEATVYDIVFEKDQERQRLRVSEEGTVLP